MPRNEPLWGIVYILFIEHLQVFCYDGFTFEGKEVGRCGTFYMRAWE